MAQKTERKLTGAEAERYKVNQQEIIADLHGMRTKIAQLICGMQGHNVVEFTWTDEVTNHSMREIKCTKCEELFAFGSA